MTSIPWMWPWMGAPNVGDPRKSALRWAMMTGRRGGRGGWGGPGHGGFPFPPGFGPPGGFGRWNARFGRGPRVGRGDVRAAVLALLAEGPHNGYQIIQEVTERSGGVWRPSAGSVYPVLQQLEDEGLARPVASGTGKAMELTEEGRRYVEEHAEETVAPWEAVRDSVGEDVMEVRELLGQVFMAVMQVQRAGSGSQVAEMRRILTDTRRSLYRLLAEGEALDDDIDDPEV
jgi:DNA-binding PadR family transcriptional regulator